MGGLKNQNGRIKKPEWEPKSIKKPKWEVGEVAGGIKNQNGKQNLQTSPKKA